MNKKEVMSLLGLIGCILYLPVVIAQAFFHDYTTALVLLFAAAAISLFNVHVYLYHTKNPEPDDTWLFGSKWMTGLWSLSFIIQTVQFIHHI